MDVNQQGLLDEGSMEMFVYFNIPYPSKRRMKFLSVILKFGQRQEIPR